MKKYRISFLGLCLAMVFLLTGCSEKAMIVNLGEYLNLEGVEYTEKKVTDADIENALIDAVTAEQEDVTIKDRGVRQGDTANIDYLGKIDGEAFEGGTDEAFDLVIGSGSFIAGFEEQIVGMKKGQTKDIKVTFPDPYINNPDLSGVEAVFTVKVNSITGKVVPEKITNAMIKEISDTYTTVKEYRAFLKSELEAAAEVTNNQNKETAVWDLVLAGSTVENLSNKKIRYYAKLYESNYQYYADMNGIDLNTLITEYLGMTKEQFNTEKQGFAEDSTKNCAIVEEIAKKHDLSVTDEEYEKYIEENSVSAEDKKQYGESIKDELLYLKVKEFVASKTTFVAK